MRSTSLSSWLLLAAASTTTTSAELPFDELIVYGDSLSDVGNFIALVPPGTFVPPFSNGPLAVELLADLLHLPDVTPSLHLSNALAGLPVIASGNNFAIVNARAVDDDGDLTTPDIGLPTQVNAFLANNSFAPSPEKLHLFFIGGNDILQAGDKLEGFLQESIANGTTRRELDGSFTSGEKKGKKGAKEPKGPKKEKEPKKGKKGKEDPPPPVFDWRDYDVFFEAQDAVVLGVQSLIFTLQTLIELGGTNIVVLNVADMGLLPTVNIVAQRLEDAATSPRDKSLAAQLPAVHTEFSILFNEALQDFVDAVNGNNGNAVMMYFDFFDLTRELSQPGVFFDEVELPCLFTFTGNGTINPECDDFPIADGFLFWDEAHTTTVANAIGAERLAEQVMDTFGYL